MDLAGGDRCCLNSTRGDHYALDLVGGKQVTARQYRATEATPCALSWPD